jgi:hypothetical protein
MIHVSVFDAGPAVAFARRLAWVENSRALESIFYSERRLRASLGT